MLDAGDRVKFIGKLILIMRLRKEKRRKKLLGKTKTEKREQSYFRIVEDYR